MFRWEKLWRAEYLIQGTICHSLQIYIFAYTFFSHLTIGTSIHLTFSQRIELLNFSLLLESAVFIFLFSNWVPILKLLMIVWHDKMQHLVKIIKRERVCFCFLSLLKQFFCLLHYLYLIYFLFFSLHHSAYFGENTVL